MNTPAKRSRLPPSGAAAGAASRAAQKQVLPQAPSKNLRSAGGGAKAGGVRGRNKFSALLDEEDASPIAVAIAVEKPVVSLANEDTGKWGEDEYVLHPAAARWAEEVESTYWIHKPVVYLQEETVETEEEEEKDWYDLEQELWSQSFAADLQMMDAAQDIFDCQDLTDEAYGDFMTFLYENGWNVRHEERRFVQATTGSEPPRVWIPPAVKAIIPIFCKKARDCIEQDCRYVHGDTISKVKDKCKFGESCGASDPSGAKRALCIRIHPGEEWRSDLCVHRLL